VQPKGIRHPAPYEAAGRPSKESSAEGQETQGKTRPRLISPRKELREPHATNRPHPTSRPCVAGKEQRW
jgi:hypothetical protein